MTNRLIAAAFVALGLAPQPASAQRIQPGMRTMIQQGGTEPGPLLGYILPGPAEAERIFREDERWVREAQIRRAAPLYGPVVSRRVTRVERKSRRRHIPLYGMYRMR